MSDGWWGCMYKRLSSVIADLLYVMASLMYGVRYSCWHCPKNKIKESAGSYLTSCDTWQWFFLYLVPLLFPHRTWFLYTKWNTCHFKTKSPLLTFYFDFFYLFSRFWEGFYFSSIMAWMYTACQLSVQA